MAQTRRKTSKRSQTPATTAVDPVLARRRRPPRGPRTISWKYLVPLAGLLILIGVAVLVNWLVAVKAPGDAPILQINTRVIRWNEFVSLLRSQKLGAEAYGGSFNAGIAPYRLMQNIAEGELILQASAREGLQVTDADIRDEIKNRLLDDADAEGDPGQIESELKVAISRYLATTQLSRSQYESIVRVDLLRGQLREKVGAEIPRVKPQALVNIIRIADPQVIEQVRARLESGEPFSQIARQLSSDDETRREGGVIGWVPRGVSQNIDHLLFGLDVGEVSQPVATDNGFYLIRKLEQLGDQARLQAIIVDTAVIARETLRRLDQGVRFEDLSVEVSIDPTLRANRGNLGIVAPGDFDGSFDLLIRGLETGVVSPPFADIQETLFILISERSAAREVTEENLTTLKTRALESWLRTEWDLNFITYCPQSDDDCFSNLKVDKAIAEIGNVSRTKFEEANTATAQARNQPQQSFPFGP